MSEIEIVEDRGEKFKFATTKPVILENPGVKLTDIYYNAINTQVDDVEITYNLGKYTTNLTSPLFNGTSQVIIANDSLVGNVYLHLELDDLLANQALCRGWGYASVRQINYILGSSNVSQLFITGQTLWQINQANVQSQEKRSEMFRLGGQEQFGAGPVEPADILLPFPFSSACFGKKPLDSNMLQNPIQIQVQFNDSNIIYGGTDLNRPTQFLNAQIIVRQGEFENKSNSLGMLLRNNQSLHYSYPFIHHQSYGPISITSSGSRRIDIPLLSFINADLTGISLGVVKSTDFNSGATGAPNPFNYVDLDEINLNFNGNTMYNSPGKLYKLAMMECSDGPMFWHGSIINPIVNDSDPVDNYMLMIDFSRLRATCFHNKFFNVWRIENNTLSIAFNVPEASTSYIIFPTYYYNAIAKIQRGQTQMIFN